MKFQMMPLLAENERQFKQDMQEAFQLGAENTCGKLEWEILAERDIDQSLNMDGATAWQAMVDGVLVGGAITIVHKEQGELAFLYVKHNCQGRKIGQQIWQFIETEYPAVKVWETCTPYFEKRNIHFYINCCGFMAVEFYNPHNRQPEVLGQDDGEHDPEEEYFFRFKKIMGNG